MSISYERSEGAKRPTKSFYYLVTIKRNALGYTKMDYLNQQYYRLVKMYNRMEWSSEIGYELDSLNRLHLHTIVHTDRQPTGRYGRTGWHIHFQPFNREDYERVCDYIHKDRKKYFEDPMQVESANIIYNTDINKLFI